MCSQYKLTPIYEAPIVAPRIGSINGWVTVALPLRSHPYSVSPSVQAAPLPHLPVKRKRAARTIYSAQQKRIVMFVIQLFKSEKIKSGYAATCSLFNIINVGGVYRWKEYDPPLPILFAESRPGVDVVSRSLEVVEKINDWSSLSNEELVMLYESHRLDKEYEEEVFCFLNLVGSILE